MPLYAGCITSLCCDWPGAVAKLSLFLRLPTSPLDVCAEESQLRDVGRRQEWPLEEYLGFNAAIINLLNRWSRWQSQQRCKSERVVEHLHV